MIFLALLLYMSKFEINGQGVVIFSHKDISNPCKFVLCNKHNDNKLEITFEVGKVQVKYRSQTLVKKLIDENNHKGLVDLNGAYYWFSLDSKNETLYAGIGEPRLETKIYQYVFQSDKTTNDKEFLDGLSSIDFIDDNTKPHILKILKDPITSGIPLVVKNTNELTMLDVAKGTYLPKSNLSHVAQQLYDCISGTSFVLDDHDFPDFSKAIEYSIKTEGCICNTILKNKATEFNKDKPNILETYLRITLGKNNGESPGIPYVMEIWPVGHYSPIHSHGNANAIIRVLYGKIHVKLFPFLCSQKKTIEPFGEKDFDTNEITWISPTLNQTHQLTNLDTNTKTCITIQCYMYDENNKKHYEYFDYLDANGKKQQYEPDSDMDFVEFKSSIKKEYQNRSLK